jgi:hypothetical protein
VPILRSVSLAVVWELMMRRWGWQGDETFKIECRVVPIRVDTLVCPTVNFTPMDVRQAVSPRSRRQVRIITDERAGSQAA